MLETGTKKELHTTKDAKFTHSDGLQWIPYQYRGLERLVTRQFLSKKFDSLGLSLPRIRKFGPSLS